MYTRVIIVLTSLVIGSSAAAADPDRIADLEWRIESLEARIRSQNVASQILPETVKLLDMTFPLHLSDVRERVEREFYVALQDRATLVLWQKRAGRAFAEIEAQLQARGLPDDLKYVAVIESGLRHRARSWAGAVGPWQFMAPTARDRGLSVGKDVDHRRDLHRSTRAALDYLSSLHKRFGDWALALAAYNCGQGRVSRSLRNQGVKSYWDLALPNEAERYVSRVAAAKIVLSGAERYGIAIPAQARFEPHREARVSIRARSVIPLVKVARAAGTTYRHMKELNPWLVSTNLIQGTHTLAIPRDAALKFNDRFAAINVAAPAKKAKVKSRTKKRGAAAAKTARASKRKTARASKKRRKTSKKRHKSHKVRSGESLWIVADRYGLSVNELKRKNGMRRSNVIHPGQVLRIR